jgi:hypothetical protein
MQADRVPSRDGEPMRHVEKIFYMTNPALEKAGIEPR